MRVGTEHPALDADETQPMSLSDVCVLRGGYRVSDEVSDAEARGTGRRRPPPHRQAAAGSKRVG